MAIWPREPKAMKYFSEMDKNECESIINFLDDNPNFVKEIVYVRDVDDIYRRWYTIQLEEYAKDLLRILARNKQL